MRTITINRSDWSGKQVDVIITKESPALIEFRVDGADYLIRMTPDPDSIPDLHLAVFAKDNREFSLARGYVDADDATMWSEGVERSIETTDKNAIVTVAAQMVCNLV